MTITYSSNGGDGMRETFSVRSDLTLGELIEMKEEKGWEAFKVRVNGSTITEPNTPLHDGDRVSVTPEKQIGA